jgi:endo-1,4-beta-xylanase
MVVKKLFAGILTSALMLTSVSVPVLVSAQANSGVESGNTSSATSFNDDFESGLMGWGPRGTETVSLVTGEAHSGSQSLSVSGRTKTWHGATVNKETVLELGQT